MDPLEQAPSFLHHVQREHPDDRLAIFYHIDAQAESPQQAVLTLSLLMIDTLKGFPKHKNTPYIYFYECLLPFACGPHLPHDKLFVSTMHRLRLISKHLIQQLAKEKPYS